MLCLKKLNGKAQSEFSVPLFSGLYIKNNYSIYLSGLQKLNRKLHVNHLAKYPAWSKCSKILPIVMKILWVVGIYVFSSYKISTQFSGDHPPMPSKSPVFIRWTPLTTAAHTGRTGILIVSVLGHSPPPGQWGAGLPAARGRAQREEWSRWAGAAWAGGAEDTLSLIRAPLRVLHLPWASSFTANVLLA